MKKTLLILCLLLLVGCSNQANGMANPMTSRDSLEEVNEITHGNITRPGVMGITQEGFYTIETKEGIIGEYDFVLNDVGYTIRFSDTIVNNDISGVYIDGNPAFSDDLSVTQAEGADLKLARWFNTDGQYVFMAPNTVSDDVFRAMYDEVSALTNIKN